MADALQGLTIVASETHVEIEWLRLRVEVVAFDSPEEEAAYCAADLELATRIDAVVRAASPNASRKSLMYTSDDWSPIQCCSVTLYLPALKVDTLVALQGLLVGPFSTWRIFVNVVESPDTQVEVGNLFLTRDRAVVQRGVHERLQHVA